MKRWTVATSAVAILALIAAVCMGDGKVPGLGRAMGIADVPLVSHKPTQAGLVAGWAELEVAKAETVPLVGADPQREALLAEYARLGMRPRYRADCDRDGALTTADFAAFIEAWKAGSAWTDTDRDGSIGVSDVARFSEWFGRAELAGVLEC